MIRVVLTAQPRLRVVLTAQPGCLESYLLLNHVSESYLLLNHDVSGVEFGWDYKPQKDHALTLLILRSLLEFMEIPK